MSLKLLPQPPKQPLKDLADYADEMAQEARERDLLQPGFPKLTRLCQPGSNRLWVIGGRPGACKTYLGWNLALNLASMGRRVLFVSLEMRPQRLALMALARYSGLEQQRILVHYRDEVRFDAAEEAKYTTAMLRWNALRTRLAVHSAEADGRTLRQVGERIREAAWDTVVLDHLRLIARSDLGELERCIEALRYFSAEKGRRPLVIALSPFNREIDKAEDEEKRIPRLSDFWGSSAIEYAADVAIGLQKRGKLDSEDPVSQVDAFVLKNRDGPAPACIPLEAHGPTAFVYERTTQEPTQQHWTEPEER